jgi:hypothetical protein
LQGYLELEGKQAKMNIFAKINGQKALDLNKMGKESLLDIEKEYGNIDLLMIETGMKNWKSQMI